MGNGGYMNFRIIMGLLTCFTLVPHYTSAFEDDANIAQMMRETDGDSTGIIKAIKDIAQNGLKIEFNASNAATESLNSIAAGAHALAHQGIKINSLEINAQESIATAIRDAGNGLSNVAEKGIRFYWEASALKTMAVIGVGLGLSGAGIALMYKGFCEAKPIKTWRDFLTCKPVIGAAMTLAGLALTLKSDRVVARLG